jgi:hypothetical protein
LNYRPLGGFCSSINIQSGEKLFQSGAYRKFAPRYRLMEFRCIDLIMGHKSLKNPPAKQTTP